MIANFDLDQDNRTVLQPFFLPCHRLGSWIVEGFILSYDKSCYPFQGRINTKTIILHSKTWIVDPKEIDHTILNGLTCTGF